MKRLKLFFACLLMAVLSIGQVWADNAAKDAVLFSENFDGYSADAVPSGSVSSETNHRVIFGNGSVTYASANGSGSSAGATKVMNAQQGAEGTLPELMVGKKGSGSGAAGGTFSISGIPSGGAKEITVSYKQNAKTLAATITGTGYSTTFTSANAKATTTFDITVADGADATFTLTLQATTTNNVRVDDICITVKTAGTGGAPTPTLSLTPNSWDFGNVATDGEASKAFSLSGSNLTAGDLTISVPSGYSVSPNSLSVSAGTLDATEFTVIKNTNTAGAYDGDFTIYGGGVAQANAVSASLSMTVVAPVDPDITFNNGTVEVGEDLDLSSLFTSNSEGAVTYSIIEGSSYASLSGSVLTGEVIGDVTIQASQAANAGYNAKSVTATINVVAALSKSSLIFTAACGGSGTANDGAAWAVTSDAATESAFDNTKGIHYGTGTSGTGDVQYITLSTSDIIGTIKKIVVDASTASGVTATVDVTVGGDAFGGDAQSLSSTATNYTFTGSASGEIVVTITKPSKAAKALYCKSIIVSYEAAPDEPAVTVDPTSVSLATPDAVDDGVIDVTYTNIDETQITVTLSDDEDGNVPFSGSWLTANLNVDKDIAYTVTENSGAARSAYIRLTAKASNGTSPDVVKKIQVTQVQGIPTYTTLNAIFNAATSTNETVKVSFNDWVVSAVTTDKAYVTDGTYGLIIYTASHGFEVGDILSGTKQTQLKNYNGNSQLSGLKASDFVKTTGGVITPRVVSDPTTLSGANAGSVVKISGELTEASSKYYIGTIQIYNGLSYDFGAPTTGKVYDCTGVFAMFNSTKEVMPRQDGDLVESVETPTAVITFNDFSIENGQNITLAATVAPAVAASAEVTYSIVDGGEYVSLVGDELTANEIGIAHIRATVADNLPNYYGATKVISVTVTAPDSRKTAVIDGITAVSGTLVTETAGTHKDKEYVSYEAKKGNAANAPVIPSGKSFVRIYQNGGYLAINAVKGCLIDEVIVSIPNTCNPTTIAVGTDEENLPTTGGTSATAGNNFSTGTGLNSQNVYLVCLGADKDHRLEVGAITVKYTGDPISVKSIAVSGTYQTEFTKNATFNHDGVVVTATYTDDSQANVTTLAEFSDPDMSTIGQKEITVSYGGESTSYNIEVVAATLTEIAISGTYPTRFNVGDAFSHAGMTVTATYSDFSEEDVTNDATFSGYNMTVGGIQTVTVEYGDQSAQYSIIVVPANTDVITAADLAATNTQYKAFSGVTDLGTSAVYAGKTAKSAAGAIQVRTSANEDGIVVTSQNDTKVVKSVAIDFATEPTSPKVLQIYGKHTAYSSAADLFDDEKKGDLIGSLGEDGSVDCTAANYEFIGIRSSDGAMYLASVMVTWGDAVIPPTVYTVTFNTDGGSTIDPVEVEEGQAVAKPADPTKDNYNFVEWQLNGVAYDFTAAVTANITLDAVWEPVTPPEPAYTEVRNDLTEGWYYTMCLDKAVTAVKAGSIWRVLSKAANGTDVILEEVTGKLDAGRPYIFRAAASTLEVAYTGDAVGAPITTGNNGLIGSFTGGPIEQSPNNYIIYDNALYYVNSGNVSVGAHRAYLDMTGVPAYNPGAGAPRRRVVMTVHGEQTATGMENVQGDNVQCTKVLINGQMYILRGEKLFDATGRLVK